MTDDIPALVERLDNLRINIRDFQVTNRIPGWQYDDETLEKTAAALTRLGEERTALDECLGEAMTKHTLTQARAEKVEEFAGRAEAGRVLAEKRAEKAEAALAEELREAEREWDENAASWHKRWSEQIVRAEKAEAAIENARDTIYSCHKRIAELERQLDDCNRS